MKDRFIFLRSGASRSRSRGFALVIVLAFVVLLTFVVVAFLIRSLSTQQVEAGSLTTFRTEQLSLSALDVIIADLRTEIEAGSSKKMPINGITVYKPRSNFAMVPARVISSQVPAASSAFRSLVKQSVSNKPFFPASALYAGPDSTAPNPTITGASGVSTATPSKNGRKVDAARWNLPLLLQGAGFTGNDLPEWIYYAKNGGLVFPTAPNDDIVGRIAYNIYDIGGLLNCNVAGFAGAATDRQMAALKGTVAGADLTQIPGITSPDGLVQWRNGTTASSVGNYINYLRNTAILGGFLQPSANDKFFVGRQDLIGWVKSNGGNQITTAALPFLTHFSREVNAPSWVPTTPGGSTIDYAAQSDNAGWANRFAPGVRVSAEFTRANGKTAKRGEPLIATRFPLSRIAGIGVAGIDISAPTTMSNGVVVPASPATVLRDFGLVWGGDGSWIYTGPTGGTVSASTIKTLDMVASENREPNFFEYLKAAILSGSLGKDGGISNSNTVTYDQTTDYQIIQIGLNIIDQYRSDDFATRVVFDGDRAPVFAGSTSLPSITKIIRMAYRQPAGFSTPLGPQTSYRSFLGGWYVPELWNPYRSSSMAGLENRPSALRVRAKTDDAALLQCSYSVTTQPEAKVAESATTFSESGSSLNFSETEPASFSIPTPLASSVKGMTASTGNPDNVISDPGGFVSLYGIYVGTVNVYDSRPQYGTPTSLPAQYTADVMIQTDPSVTFFVEYQDLSGRWRSYDIMKNTETLLSPGIAYNEQGLVSDSGAFGKEGITFYNADYLPFLFKSNLNLLLKPIACSAAARVDPRTDRFGTGNDYASQLGYLRAKFTSTSPTYYRSASLPFTPSNSLGYAPARGGAGMRGVSGIYGLIGGTSPGWFNGADGWGNFPGALTDNKPGGNMYYSDQDGIVRRAAGAYKDCYMDDLDMRPVMINRSFTSVGDMGFANRGEPWKDINFFTQESGDAALLDFFTAYEEPVVTAGKVSLNSAPPEVLSAILSSSIMTEAGTASTQTSASVALSLASALSSDTLGTAGAYANRSDLVTRFSGSSALADYPEKSRREVCVRALSQVSQTRTWNLLIDLVVQTGKFQKAATSLADFTMSGERRIWVSLAIDRVTGEVIDQSMEIVHE